MKNIFKNPFSGFDAFDSMLILWLGAIALLATGYALNILKVIALMPASFSDIDPIYALRVISIFAAPLGGVIGWF